MRNKAKEAGNLDQLHCTVQSGHKQWEQPSRNFGTSIGIAIGYWQEHKHCILSTSDSQLATDANIGKLICAKPKLGLKIKSNK